MNNINTPVVIFAFNRLDHLETTITNLKQNTLASSTEIIIFSDKEKKSDEKIKVDNVRKYINSINGFKSVKLIAREKNYGLAKNIIEGVSEVIQKYGAVIVLEDDLITSKNFLCYMNSALKYYKNKRNIFAISGYTGKLPSLSKIDNDVYLSYRPSSWGWATWKDQWEGIDWDVTDFNEFIKDKKEVQKLNRGGIDMARMLTHCMLGKNHSWAIRWSYAMYKQDKYCIYPKVSKVQNIGFGADATNCSGINIYQTDIDTSSKCVFNFIDEKIPSKELAKEFKYQYSYTNKLIKKTLEIFKGIKK